MTIKRKDFQKAAALIHEFQLKIGDDAECAELRDALNLALLHMQKYYRTLRSRLLTQDKNNGNILSASLRGLSPMTPFKDAPDRFQWKWINLDNPKLTGTLPADIHKDVTNLPPIIHATKDGNLNLLMQLIEQDDGAVLELDGIGRTALMYAVQFKKLDALQMLLEHGAEPDAIAHDGSTAVHRACHNGDHESLQILTEYRANLEYQDVQGRAPIHWACTTPQRDCLRLLLREDVSVGIRDKEGMSPSMWACRMDHIEHFELLTAAEDQEVLEEDGYERDNNGRTWMHWSVRRTGPLECLKTLLSDESACLREDEGKTVMHTATERGSVAATKLILEIAGMSCLEHRDAANRTPLILATMNGHGEMVNYLLSEGAELASVDNNGATAWDYARGRQFHYCMLIIASYIRQRAVDDGQDPNGLVNGHGTLNSAFNGTFPSMMGETMEEDNLGLTQLQINGEAEEDVIFYGNRPIAPPHPPPGPPTPRTPRAMTPRAGTPSTPRGRTTPRTPSTPRSYAVKRSPSASMDAEDQDTGETNQREMSAGSKRKKVTVEGQDGEGHMSVMSVDSGDHQPHSQGSHHSTPNVSAAEPEMVSDSQYLEHCGPHGNNAQGEHDVDSVSIGEMDVSDMGSDGREDHNDASPTAPVQPPQPHPRFNQLNPPPSPRGGQQHYYPSYSPQPPKTPPYNAHSPGEVKGTANLPDAQELEDLLQDLEKSDLDLTPQNLDFDQDKNAPVEVESSPENEKPPPSPPHHSHDDYEPSNDEDEVNHMNESYQGPVQNDATPMGEPRNGPLGGMPDKKEDDDSPVEEKPKEQINLDKSLQPLLSPLGPPKFLASSIVPQPPPTGAFGLPASMHHNQDGRVIPPAHLLPLDLPPHSPTKLKKKKKKRRDRSFSNEHQDLPPARGSVAPMSPTASYLGSAGRDRSSPQVASVEPHGPPGSAGRESRSPNRSGGGLPPTPKPRDRSPSGSRRQSYKPPRSNKKPPRGQDDSHSPSVQNLSPAALSPIIFPGSISVDAAVRKTLERLTISKSTMPKVHRTPSPNLEIAPIKPLKNFDKNSKPLKPKPRTGDFSLKVKPCVNTPHGSDHRKLKSVGPQHSATGSASSVSSRGSMSGASGSFPAHGTSHSLHHTPQLPKAHPRAKQAGTDTEGNHDEYDDDDDDDYDSDDAADREDEYEEEEQGDTFEEYDDDRRHSAGSGHRTQPPPARGYSSGKGGRRHENGPTQNSNFTRNNSSRGPRESQGSGGVRRRPADQSAPSPRARPRPAKNAVPPLNNKYQNRLPPSY